jgi:hypothetical protein
MYYGDVVLYNDEQRLRLKEASQKAAQGWRFRTVQSRGLWILSGVVEALGDAARDALDAARRGLDRARTWRLPPLSEQR